MLTPAEVRREVDAWIAGASPNQRVAFMRCKLRVPLSDGSHATYQSEPGYLLIDGERLYSAAWL